MKNIIEYFYNLNIEKITYQNDKYYILSNKNMFIFKEVNNINKTVLFETQKYKCFHTIFYNKYNNIITKYENKQYMLLRCNLGPNRPICFEDILKVSSIALFVNNVINYEILWNKKNDFFENYIKNKNNNELPYREYYDYYIGLTECAIEYAKNIEINNLRYGFSYKRIKKNYTIYDLLDPTNVIIAPIVRNIAEYIKEIETFDYQKLEKISFTQEECILLISRIIFPTYFFDICNNISENKIKKIINNSYKYEKNIYYLINYLKKRGYNIPMISWLETNRP